MEYDPKHDHYRVLGLRPEATADEVKRAFRATARRCHPDNHPNDPAAAHKKTLRVTAAGDTLRDPQKRAAYDRARARYLADVEAAKVEATERKAARERAAARKERKARTTEPSARTGATPKREATTRRTTATEATASRAVRRSSASPASTATSTPTATELATAVARGAMNARSGLGALAWLVLGGLGVVAAAEREDSRRRR